MSRRRLLFAFLVGAAVLWGMLLAPLHRPRATLPAPANGNAAPALFVSPDSRHLVSVHFQPWRAGEERGEGNRGCARLWDIAAGELVATLADRQRLITSVTFSPDGATVAARQEDGRILVWNRTTGEKLAEHTDDWLLKDTHPNTQIVYAPDGRLLYQDGQVWTRMHDVATGKLEFDLSERLEAFKNPDGFNSTTVRIQDLLFAAGGTTAVAIRIDTGEVCAIFESDGVPLDTTGALSQNGRCYAMWERDGLAVRGLVVWTPSGRKTLRGALQMFGALSNDGRWLATLDSILRPAWPGAGQPSGQRQGIVVITDTSTGREAATLPGTGSVAFTPDDRTLFVGQESGDLDLWDMPIRRRWEWIVPASVAAGLLTYWLAGWRRRPDAASRAA